MNARTRALADRRESLLQRSAMQRDDLARQCGSAGETLARIDNGLVVARRWITSPVTIGVIVALVVVLGRSRLLKSATATLGLLDVGLRIRRAASGLAAANR